MGFVGVHIIRAYVISRDNTSLPTLERVSFGVKGMGNLKSPVVKIAHMTWFELYFQLRLCHLLARVLLKTFSLWDSKCLRTSETRARHRTDTTTTTSSRYRVDIRLTFSDMNIHRIHITSSATVTSTSVLASTSKGSKCIITAAQETIALCM